MLSWILEEASLGENSSLLTGTGKGTGNKQLSQVQLSGPKSLGPGGPRVRAVAYSILPRQIGPGQEI